MRELAGKTAFVTGGACGIGFALGRAFSPYVASQFAVVGMSEGLAQQLKPHGIGVSVLCPHFVRTRIGESGRNRPERYGETQAPPDPASPNGQLLALISASIAAGLDPAGVAARVLAAIHNDELYVFTHPDMRNAVDARFAAIQAAMDEVGTQKP